VLIFEILGVRIEYFIEKLQISLIELINSAREALLNKNLITFTGPTNLMIPVVRDLPSCTEGAKIFSPFHDT